MFVNHWETLLNNFNNLFNLNMACMSAVWLTGPYKWATLPNSGLVTNPLNPELVRDCERTLEIWRESDPAPLMRVITTAIALLRSLRNKKAPATLHMGKNKWGWVMKSMLKYTTNACIKCIHDSKHFNEELRNIEIKRNALLTFPIRYPPSICAQQPASSYQFILFCWFSNKYY